MAAIKVKGMSCNHCKMSVTKALESIPGIANVQVDLLSGAVSFTETAPVDQTAVKEAIIKIGFQVE